jgi:PAS domain S-box-containing protein
MAIPALDGRVDGTASRRGTDAQGADTSQLRERARRLLRGEPSARQLELSMDVLPLVEELQLQRIELELQNDQLRSAERDLDLQNDQLRSVERELELSRAQYQELFDLAPAGYVILDTGGVIDRANRAADSLLGASHGGLVRRSLGDFTEGRDLRVLRAHLRVAAHGHHACELSLRRLDGHGLHALMESRPTPGGGCLTVLTDISERKRAEEALHRANHDLEERVQARTRELASRNIALEEALSARAASDAERSELAARLRDAERLESLGLLAGGVAHDFNNILVGVMANADLLLETTADLAPAVQEGLVTIKHAARRAADLTRQLLVYAGRGLVTLAPVSLDRLIEESVRLLRARVRANVELCAELRAADRWIRADAGQVQQVVGNLVTNALEAIGENAGRVLVRTRLEQLDAQALARFPHVKRARPGSFVVLEVEDTGMGIEAAHLSRIFEPFFTSKFTGRGLGLASVLGIVRSHRGALRVRSVPGQGSSFEIAWPLVAPGEACLPSPQPKPWKGSGQLLLVDDDPGVRQVLGRQLEQLGFVVTQAASGAAALELFRAKPSQFRLAVVDRTMPGLSGDDLIEQLHQLQPTLPVLLVSGYSAGGPVADAPHMAFVAKPMTLSDLQRALSRLLDTPVKSGSSAADRSPSRPPPAMTDERAGA